MGTRIKPKFIEIAANLTSEQFQGFYHGKQYHSPDLQAVLDRSWAAGVQRIIITGTNLESSKQALELAQSDERLYCTCGLHPTSSTEPDKFPGGPTAYFQELGEVLSKGIASGKTVAYGEFGLDYDRLQFCEKELQIKYFEEQFNLLKGRQLPLFLHMRAACGDFLDILQRNKEHVHAGVVHSFTGSEQDAADILKWDQLCIGLNGCSLRTEDNLKAVKTIPTNRIMFETDCPWCDMRPSHACSQYIETKIEQKDRKKYQVGVCVKGRTEPCHVVQVCEVVGGVQEVHPDEVADTVYKTTLDMFWGGQGG